MVEVWSWHTLHGAYRDLTNGSAAQGQSSSLQARGVSGWTRSGGGGPALPLCVLNLNLRS